MLFSVDALKRGIVAGVVGLLALSNAAFAAGDQRRADEKPDITLYGTEYSGWDFSTNGKVMVDGRMAPAIDRLLNGSHIFVDARSTARAEIKGLGRVSIAPRSELVLDIVDDTVVARMLRGNMRVEVGSKFGAYVETPDRVVVAHRGTYASFRVAADPLGTRVERDFGDVETMAAVRADDDWEIDDIDESDNLRVKARNDVSLKVKVRKDGSSVSNQPVSFAITQALDGATGGFDEGTQRVTVTTDSDGVARVDLNVGAGQGTLWVEASIPGTDTRETLHVYVDVPEKTVWNKYTVALYSAMGAGAVAGAILAVKNAGDDDDNAPPGVIVTPR
jgi:hypothetical protein